MLHVNLLGFFNDLLATFSKNAFIFCAFLKIFKPVLFGTFETESSAYLLVFKKCCARVHCITNILLAMQLTFIANSVLILMFIPRVQVQIVV